MYTRKLSGLFFFFLILIALTRTIASAAPTPTPKDKCPVCGMFVSKYPDWTSILTFKDNSSLFFDGAKDLFTYYHTMKKYTPSKNQSAIAAITVRDYYALKQIDARSAFFVLGSDVYGPMGHELIPFAKEAEAKEFMKDHKGKKILTFNEISAGTVKNL